MSTAEFDQFAASYPNLLRDPLRDRFGRDSGFFHLRKWLLIRDFLEARRMHPSAMNWLDVGCGQGELINLVGKNFARAVGCDPSERMIDSCGSGRLFAQPTASELPFPDRSFDLITAICVYHHVHGEERVRLTASIRRVLKPQGLFCMIEHNPLNPITRLIVSRCPVDRDAELLRPSIAASLIRSAGLQPLETHYFLYCPAALFSRFGRLERWLSSVPLGGQYAVFSQSPALITGETISDPPDGASRTGIPIATRMGAGK